MFKSLLLTGFFSLLLMSAFMFSIYDLSAQAGTAALSHWHELQNALSYLETDAPEKSILNDSKIFILKADPAHCKFTTLTASENKPQNRTADLWAIDFGMTVIVNAGMFNTVNQTTSKGYLKNHSHFNNRRLNGKYNVMMAMDPVDLSDTSMIIVDMTCRHWESLRSRYHTLCQGMRMIDGAGNPMAWDKRPGQACSMIVGATDISGNIYFVFSRSPYTHQQMIGFLLCLISGIRTTVYLEGGPEASLYIESGDKIIAKYGSYVSETYANDDNDHFWRIPNVIGIRPK